MIRCESEPNIFVKNCSESSKKIQMYINLINQNSKYDFILPRSHMNLINKCIKNNLAYYIKYDTNNKNPVLVNKQNKKLFCKQQSELNVLQVPVIEVFTTMSKTKENKMLKKSLSF